MKKKLLVELDQFIVSKEGSNEHDWISIKAVSGFWTMRFRDDNMMYHSIVGMAEDDSLHDYLEAFIRMCYVMSNTLLDLDFIGDFFKIYSELQDRMLAKSPSISDEEDARILEEERKFYELKEEKGKSK